MLAHSAVPAGIVDWRVQFAEVFERGGFDVVLANPPYVRQELIKELKPALKSVYGDLYSGTADLYVYFYYRALELLKQGGMLVFISSNKWFRANYGARLREHIAQTCHVLGITDFGDLPVFESSMAYPMIFIAQKSDARDSPTLFTAVTSLDAPYPDVLALVREGGQPLPPKAINGSSWMLTNAGTAGLIGTMKATGIPLGEYVHGHIYYGIKTGFNQAFVIDGAKRAELIEQDARSTEIIKPLTVGKDVRRWCIADRDQWLIVTPIGISIERYPVVFEHLEQWQAQLEKRWDKGKH